VCEAATTVPDQPGGHYESLEKYGAVISTKAGRASGKLDPVIGRR